jgi:hypothetical protein
MVWDKNSWGPRVQAWSADPLPKWAQSMHITPGRSQNDSNLHLPLPALVTLGLTFPISGIAMQTHSVGGTEPGVVMGSRMAIIRKVHFAPPPAVGTRVSLRGGSWEQ